MTYRIPLTETVNALYNDDKFMERTEAAYHIAVNQGKSLVAKKLLSLYQDYISDTYAKARC